MATFSQIKFTAADIVNGDDWIAAGESNPHNVRPWLFHDHGITLAVVFADDLGDALDIAADDEKLDRYEVSPEDRPEYEGSEERLSFLGNYCEPYDIESLGIVELPNVRRTGYVEAFELTYPEKQ